MHFGENLYCNVHTCTHVHVVLLLQLYCLVILQNQAQLIREALGQLGDTNPPLFDPLGEGVDESQLTLSVVEGQKKKGKVSTHCIFSKRDTFQGNNLDKMLTNFNHFPFRHFV